MMQEKKKANYFALLPIGVFLVLYLGLGILLEYCLKIEMGFYNIPIVGAFMVAILVACCQNRAVSFDEKLEIMAKGIGDKNIMTMILIFLVKTPLGISSHGATRWIGIPHTGFNLQPAEVAKLCMILFLASLVCKMGKSVRTMKGFFIMMGAPLPIAACVYLITDNLSSAIIIMGIAVLMVFVASPDYKKFVIMGLSVVAAAALLVFVVVQMGDKIGTFRLARIQAWLNPESQAQDKGFQTLQALYAIGSGGIWGKGLGQSMQKLSFLPEAQNDMIFSIICEELGLFGAVAIILMFIMLLWRMMVIANNAPDLFGAMLVVGVMGHIAIQAILNIAVVTNSIPNTGISLPCISYGGSSALFLLAEIGLFLSVARRIQLKEL